MVKVVLAPAKVNLSLRIRGCRADGYHYIESVMHQVDWGDTLTVRYDPSGPAVTTLEVNKPWLPDGPGNLAWQAVEELRKAAGLQGRVDLNLVKRIPVGAGLGGGSSDAAAVLKAVNELAGLGLSTARLEDLGYRLGTDVPFAVRGGAALVEGVGERLTPLSSGLRLPILLVHSGQALSTPTVYEWWDEHHPVAGNNHVPGVVLEETRGLITAVSEGSSGDWDRLLLNELEPVVCSRVPVVDKVLALLRESPSVTGAAMTGTGSTVFALLRETERPTTLLNALRGRYRTTLTRFAFCGERREQ